MLYELRQSYYVQCRSAAPLRLRIMSVTSFIVEVYIRYIVYQLFFGYLNRSNFLEWHATESTTLISFKMFLAND
uniref:Uncharacterized protein n=1 Tax=Pararge aegeria TaxID=116150 RepID=S4PKA3_9NEOP